MKTKDVKERFFAELESGLPEVDGMPQKGKGAHSSSFKKPLLAIILSSVLALSAVLGIVIVNSLPNAASSPYLDDIVSLLEPTASESASALPDFRWDLMDPSNGFYRIETRHDNDEDRKIGLYLPISLAREAEANLQTDNLLRDFVDRVRGGCISYADVTEQYLKQSKTIEYKASDQVPFHQGNWELIGLFHQCHYTIAEEIIQEESIDREGTYFISGFPTREGETVIEGIESFQSNRIYVSRPESLLGEIRNRLPRRFLPYGSHDCGFLRDGQFCYHGSYYSPEGEHYSYDDRRVYSISELDEASTVLEGWSANPKTYQLPYETFKAIVRDRAAYYRDPITLDVSATFHQLEEDNLPSGKNNWLVESTEELSQTGLSLDLLSRYDDAFFSDRSLLLYSESYSKYLFATISFDRLDRRGDSLELHLSETECMEKNDWSFLWTIEIPKSALEGKNPGFFSCEIQMIPS